MRTYWHVIRYTSRLGSIIEGKAFKALWETIRAGDWLIQSGQDLQCHLIMSVIFEIQNYYQKPPKFHGVYCRNNLLEIKNGGYVINLE